LKGGGVVGVGRVVERIMRNKLGGWKRFLFYAKVSMRVEETQY
jgi:hypothetical protein